MLEYINEPRAMHPEPSYTRIYRPDFAGKIGATITIEERTS